MSIDQIVALVILLLSSIVLVYIVHNSHTDWSEEEKYQGGAWLIPGKTREELQEIIRKNSTGQECVHSLPIPRSVNIQKSLNVSPSQRLSAYEKELIGKTTVSYEDQLFLPDDVKNEFLSAISNRLESLPKSPPTPPICRPRSIPLDDWSDDEPTFPERAPSIILPTIPKGNTAKGKQNNH